MGKTRTFKHGIIHGTERRRNRFWWLNWMGMHQVERWIQEGEHQQQDFKFLVSDSRKIARTLSSFANTAGGRLLIGIKDNGRVSGIRSDEEIYMIDTAAKYFTRPAVSFEAEVHRVQNKLVLEVRVNPSPALPHQVKMEDGRWKAYLRIGDEDCLADAVIRHLWKHAQSPKPVMLKYSEKERLLLDFLARHPFITPRRFMQLARVPFGQAVETLAKLTSWGILRYQQGLHGLVYVAAEMDAPR